MIGDAEAEAKGKGDGRRGKVDGRDQVMRSAQSIIGPTRSTKIENAIAQLLEYYLITDKHIKLIK